MTRHVLVLLMLAACGDGAGAGPDASTIDAAVDAAPPTLTYSGRIIETGGVSGTRGVTGATITIVERPGVSATSGTGGNFTIEVLADQVTTLNVEATGHPRYRQRSLTLHASQGAATFVSFIPTQSELDQINIDGGAAPGSGVIGIVVVPVGSCMSTGGGLVLATQPSSGTVKYVSMGVPVDSQASATGPTAITAYNAYVVGASGTVTPTVVSTPSCAQAPYPVSPQPYFTVQGAATVIAGTFTGATVFLQ